MLKFFGSYFVPSKYKITIIITAAYYSVVVRLIFNAHFLSLFCHLNWFTHLEN